MTTPAMTTRTTITMATTTTPRPSLDSWRASSASDRMPRVKPWEVLEQPQRRRIYEEIRDRPGRTLGGLVVTTELNSNTIQWHAQKLRRAGLVITETYFGQRLFHATANGSRGRLLGRSVALLADPRSSRVRELVNGGMDAKDVAAFLGRSLANVEAIVTAMHIAHAVERNGQPEWGLLQTFPGIHKVPSIG